MKMVCLDDMVTKTSPARIIDHFIDLANLRDLGFDTEASQGKGRPSYSARHLTKLYLYGYYNAVRSSRKLEECCHVNVEVMWLMEGLSPDFKTIADFRKNNREALMALFSCFGDFLKANGLIGGGICAVDGTKIKASSSKKTNFSKKKLAKLLEYHADKADGYLKDLECADSAEAKRQAEDELAKSRAQTGKYEGYLEELENTGRTEISETDPDSRMMQNSKAGVSVAYNLQAVVDARHNVIVATDVVCAPSDQGQLSGMAVLAEAVLGKNGETTYLADKGYFCGEDLAVCEEKGIQAIVARQDKPGEKDRVRKAFSLDKFLYDKDSDSYTCPAGQVLGPRSKKDSKQHIYHNKKACKICVHRSVCLPKKSAHRKIFRDEHSDVLDRFAKAYADNKELYRLRQQIVEPVFGVLKRAMGFEYFLLRTKKKVVCEVALVTLAYNMKRALSVLGFDKMMQALDAWAAQRQERPSPTPLLASEAPIVCPSWPIFTQKSAPAAAIPMAA
jgi:transposase